MTDEETREYLAAVFVNDLDSQALLSNNSKWINFLLVKNQVWSFENVVLLGDSLHTAHFSIGSGTKLAMEDAIDLAKCLAEAPTVRDALKSFELKRKPVIEDYQDAAFDSMIWFENAASYMHLSPYELAFSAMMRSGRVGFEDLKKRDPVFVERYLENSKK